MFRMAEIFIKYLFIYVYLCVNFRGMFVMNEIEVIKK